MAPEHTCNAVGKKVWVFAGEASGDLYGAHLARALEAQAPGLRIDGMGGAEMAAAGVNIMVDSTDLGVVGLLEVLKHYPTFRRIFRDLLRRAERERPDLVVLIDYPGFNLRFAKRLAAIGIPVVYYVSPQVWAWGKRRVPEMARILRRMLVIFPFETTVYERAGLPVEFVGHPLIEILQTPGESEETRDENLVLLMPGSRFSEVDRLLEPLVLTAAELASRRPATHFVIPTPRSAVRERVGARLDRLVRQRGLELRVEVVCDETPKWMRRAAAGIAASGTTTVQSAILGLPLVVAYRVNPITYLLLSRFMVDVPYITMVNLVADDLVYEEFLQGDVRPDNLLPALERILPGGERRTQTLAGMDAAVAALGGQRSASQAAARAVLAELGG